jgi:acyl carrier protein phosphodiesterase
MEYTESFYKSALEDKDLLPEAARNMLTFMQRDNWLFNYQYLEGIHRSLTGMSHRTSFESKMQEATEDLKKDYALYEADFRLFFPILTQHVSQLILK